MIAPPDYVIEAARLAAIQSPCMKSKRGVCLFNPEQADREQLANGIFANTNERLAFRASFVIVSSGFNGPPRGFDCKDNADCRGWCREVCMHAEQRAIIAALSRDDAGDLELVHAKVVVDGQVVAGGGPSCLQCSRLVVDVGLRGVWLYEQLEPPVIGESNGTWRFYSAETFHEATLASEGLASLGVR